MHFVLGLLTSFYVDQLTYHSHVGGPSLEKYRALLAGIEEGEEEEVDQEMEITWTTGLEDNKEVLIYYL